jgi:hypothetical protein
MTLLLLDLWKLSNAIKSAPLIELQNRIVDGNIQLIEALISMALKRSFK